MLALWLYKVCILQASRSYLSWVAHKNLRSACLNYKWIHQCWHSFSAVVVSLLALLVLLVSDENFKIWTILAFCLLNIWTESPSTPLYTMFSASNMQIITLVSCSLYSLTPLCLSLSTVTKVWLIFLICVRVRHSAVIRGLGTIYVI